MSRQLLPVLAVVSVMGCEDSGRDIRTAEWQPLWTYGASASDTVLANPIQLVANDSVLYVLDGQRQDIIGLDAKSGQVLWTSGVRGSGPDEIGQILTVALSPSGVIAPDAVNGWGLSIGPSGSVQTALSFVNVGPIRSMCLTSGHHIAVTQSVPSLTIISDNGQRLERIRPPWPSLSDGPIHTSFGLLSPVIGSGSGCILAMQVADGLARWDSDRWSAVGTFVEPLVPAKQIGETDPVGAIAVAADSSSVAVLFGGNSKHALSLVDYYDPDDLMYRYSVLLPEPLRQKTSWMARSGELYYFIVLADGLPGIAAYRMTTEHR